MTESCPTAPQTLFCAQTINSRLIHTDIQLQLLSECDSTNLHLLRLVRQGIDVHGQAILTHHQTQGQGRQGKTWTIIPGGSLPLSLAWRFPPDTSPLSALPLVIALTVWQVLTALGIPVQIKWPNDIVIEQAKLGGISVQILSGAVAIIGVGLNLQAPEIDQPTLGIWDYAPRCNASHLATFLLLALNQSLLQFQKNGFSLFKKAYLNACRDLDKPVILWHNQRILAQGLMAGVEETGALILHTAQGNKQFTVGEISLRSGVAG